MFCSNTHSHSLPLFSQGKWKCVMATLSSLFQRSSLDQRYLMMKDRVYLSLSFILLWIREGSWKMWRLKKSLRGTLGISLCRCLRPNVFHWTFNTDVCFSDNKPRFTNQISSISFLYADLPSATLLLERSDYFWIYFLFWYTAHPSWISSELPQWWNTSAASRPKPAEVDHHLFSFCCSATSYIPKTEHK